MSHTTTTNRMGEMIAKTAAAPMQLSKALLGGVTAETFAKQPVVDGKPIDTNHPAFVYGHLALYPARLIAALGGDTSAVACPGSYEELFKAGCPCEHDAAGGKYPSMDEVVSKFESGYAALIEAVRNTDDETFMRPAEEGRYREMFGTLGGMANFMLHDHVMFHLGQVSAWRRMMGLSSVM